MTAVFSNFASNVVEYGASALDFLCTQTVNFANYSFTLLSSAYNYLPSTDAIVQFAKEQFAALTNSEFNGQKAFVATVGVAGVTYFVARRYFNQNQPNQPPVGDEPASSQG